ncbi:hypothetical protein [Streptococcus ferus]|uniref:hypothetical protein n=1 Tax=Streptococcus ferus TaxID=1345 RepID=UPI0035A172AB
MFFRRKPKLTKEQQDNVVKRIVRGYAPITSVEFTQFSKDFKTGFYLLSFELNGNSDFATTIFLKSLERFDDDTGALLLGPMDNFKELERHTNLPDKSDVDISHVSISYLRGK